MIRRYNRRVSHRRYATSEESTARVGAQLFLNIWNQCVKKGKRVQNSVNFDQMVNDVMQYGLLKMIGSPNTVNQAQNWLFIAEDLVDRLSGTIEALLEKENLKFDMNDYYNESKDIRTNPEIRKLANEITSRCGKFDSTSVGMKLAEVIYSDISDDLFGVREDHNIYGIDEYSDRDF